MRDGGGAFRLCCLRRLHELMYKTILAKGVLNVSTNSDFCIFSFLAVLTVFNTGRNSGDNTFGIL